mmetsp:Transcript_131776/g.299625  ORF Transcript_131776/g.299625 Transcript_131776/m.299625 type:complete len:211 (+) Transcript_131776:532-1164(+)
MGRTQTDVHPGFSVRTRANKTMRSLDRLPMPQPKLTIAVGTPRKQVTRCSPNNEESISNHAGIHAAKICRHRRSNRKVSGNISVLRPARVDSTAPERGIHRPAIYTNDSFVSQPRHQYRLTEARDRPSNTTLTKSIVTPGENSSVRCQRNTVRAASCDSYNTAAPQRGECQGSAAVQPRFCGLPASGSKSSNIRPVITPAQGQGLRIRHS